MAKKFAPRVKKKERKTIDLSSKLTRDLFKLSDEMLLKDARLEEVQLKDINVLEQVRTKFNDRSIKDLGENIRVNGLIQPLVLHKSDGKLTLICGERRFRAMTLIKKESAPCFILDNKNADELMAIQFSENSSREELHFIDKADGILNYKNASQASERQIVKALGASKSEVHRSLLIAKLPTNIKEAAKQFNIEKYVLLEWGQLDEGNLKKKIEKSIIEGKLVKRAQLKKMIGSSSPVVKTKAPEKSPAPLKTPAAVVAPASAPAVAPAVAPAAALSPSSDEELLEIVKKRSKDLKLDKKTKALLNKIVKQPKAKTKAKTSKTPPSKEA